MRVHEASEIALTPYFTIVPFYRQASIAVSMEKYQCVLRKWLAFTFDKVNWPTGGVIKLKWVQDFEMYAVFTFIKGLNFRAPVVSRPSGKGGGDFGDFERSEGFGSVRRSSRKRQETSYE